MADLEDEIKRFTEENPNANVETEKQKKARLNKILDARKRNMKPIVPDIVAELELTANQQIEMDAVCQVATTQVNYNSTSLIKERYSDEELAEHEK